ncbi:MAG: hypothetical protein WBQ44_22970, partial [Rhodococcus sp. (in: high G+C Gram-positive bacteria)]
ALVTIAIGAFVAALAWSTTVSPTFAFVMGGGDGFDALFRSAQSVTALAVVVAVMVAALAVRGKAGFVAAGFGSASLALATSVDFSADIHVRTLGAGLILGGCAALAGSSRLLQCAIVVGSFSAIAAEGPLQSYPRRYADYLETDQQTYLLVLIGVFAVLLVISLWASPFEGVPHPTLPNGRIMLVGIAIAVGGLVLHWLFERSLLSLGSGDASQGRWLLGVAVVPLLIGAAFALPAASGAVILGALAYIATTTTLSFTTSTALEFVAALLLGAVVGWRWPSALTGLTLLVVVAAAGILSDSSIDVVWSISQIVVLPFAIGLVYASLLPTNAPTALISVTAPVVVSVPIVADFGWTAYTPLTSTLTPTFSPSAWMWASTALSVLAVISAGLALIVLRRREPLPTK